MPNETKFRALQAPLDMMTVDSSKVDQKYSIVTFSEAQIDQSSLLGQIGGKARVMKLVTDLMPKLQATLETKSAQI